jgi:hypothetical protein
VKAVVTQDLGTAAAPLEEAAATHAWERSCLSVRVFTYMCLLPTVVVHGNNLGRGAARFMRLVIINPCLMLGTTCHYNMLLSFVALLLKHLIPAAFSASVHVTSPLHLYFCA